MVTTVLTICFAATVFFWLEAARSPSSVRASWGRWYKTASVFLSATMIAAGIVMRMKGYPPPALLLPYIPIVMALFTVATGMFVVKTRYEDFMSDNQMSILFKHCLFLAALFATSLLFGYVLPALIVR